MTVDEFDHMQETIVIVELNRLDGSGRAPSWSFGSATSALGERGRPVRPERLSLFATPRAPRGAIEQNSVTGELPEKDRHDGTHENESE